jgi:hypothetical protein
MKRVQHFIINNECFSKFHYYAMKSFIAFGTVYWYIYTVENARICRPCVETFEIASGGGDSRASSASARGTTSGFYLNNNKYIHISKCNGYGTGSGFELFPVYDPTSAHISGRSDSELAPIVHPSTFTICKLRAWFRISTVAKAF